MLSKYQQIIKKINGFDFSKFDDADLLNRITQLKDELSNAPDNTTDEVFAIIREVIDRRLGIWKLFDSDLPENINKNSIRKIYATVREKHSLMDSSLIHLDASFYKEIRRLRLPQNGLTFMPYNVQLIGALALLDGKIAEMGTGEGKTVVAVFPACVWALSGRKVHIATVNDYLALRDCMWMGPIYRFFGLEVDCVLSHLSDSEKRNSYKADITYGNNYEFGFDYLRDNLRNKPSDRVQSKLECVIIDEIDSILMDEATTPLIISGAPDKSSSNYWRFKSIIESLIKHQKEIIEQLFKENDPELKIIRLIQIKMADPWNPQLLDYLSNDKDAVKKINSVHGKFIATRSEYKLEEDLLYVVDEKNRTMKLTDHGVAFIEQHLGEGFFTLTDQQASHTPAPLSRGEFSYSPLSKVKLQTPPLLKTVPQTPLLKGGRGDFNTELQGNESVRNFLQLLRAYVLHRKDEDYIVHNGGIIIVDEFTGRLAFGKKYEEGLHQAIECKEGLQITPETHVMGKITHPNCFRLYEKKAGMTATAHTESEEFKKLYKLEVVRIPTNKPVVRTDLQDRYYKTEEEKLKAIVDDIKECHALGRPVLIGTRSVEKSEHLSMILNEHGIPHNVLNAKNHSEEAEIIKNAGQPYAVTIATNMAGRGVDIALGKNLNIPSLLKAIPQPPPLLKTVPQTPPLLKGGRGDLNSGLHVIGTERHTTRRIDDQLIGRSGRQGDPGSSRFYLSLQDDIFRMFASEDMSAMIKAVERGYNQKMADLTRKAQRKSEETSYGLRKNLIEHDDVTNKQRKVIYKMRSDVLNDNNIETRVQSIIKDYADDLIIIFGESFTKSPEFYHSENGNPFSNHKPSLDSSFCWNDMKNFCVKDFGVDISDTDLYDLNPESAKALIVDAFQKTLEMREKALGTNLSNKLEKAILMEVLDTAWADYLSFQTTFDNIMMLRSYVKDNILTHYKLESAKLFKDLLASIRYETLKLIFTYPIPGENPDSIRWTNKNKPLSDQVNKLLL